MHNPLKKRLTIVLTALQQHGKKLVRLAAVAFDADKRWRFLRTELTQVCSRPQNTI
jgi:hypothetical protein